MYICSICLLEIAVAFSALNDWKAACSRMEMRQIMSKSQFRL